MDRPFHDEDDIVIIPPDVSPVRFMTSLESGLPHLRFASLADARKGVDGVLVMEADTGGQILLTCPVGAVQATDGVLAQLLADLEEITWGRGGLADDAKADEAAMYFERHPVGSGIAGGMGGGVVRDDLWVHLELRERGIEAAIGAVIRGERARLDVSTLMPSDAYRKLVDERWTAAILAYLPVFAAFVEQHRGADVACAHCGRSAPLSEYEVRPGETRPPRWAWLCCPACARSFRPDLVDDGFGDRRGDPGQDA